MKSSFSDQTCVDVERKIVKSSFSGGNGCVSVEYDDGTSHDDPGEETFYVTDTKHKDQMFAPVLAFNRAEWDAFIKGVKAGEFDYLLEVST